MPTTAYLGLARGIELDAKPTVSASTTSLSVEVALLVDDGAGTLLTRAEALANLEAIRGHLAVCSWPPT
jgi:hypothetical protein